MNYYQKRITSIQNPIIKHFLHLRQNKSYREEQKTCVVVGKFIIQEVCPYIDVKKLLVYNETAIPPGVNAQEVLLVSEDVMKKVTGIVSPDGFCAEIPIPEQSSLDNMSHILVIDGVSDPGNVGTILRTALALGWEGVCILENSCDPFNEKALRAAKGATFRLPILQTNWSILKEIIVKNQLKALVADCYGKDIREIGVLPKIALILCSESAGPSKETLENCESVTIPMPGNMESLNVAVAGGILMYGLRPMMQQGA